MTITVSEVARLVGGTVEGDGSTVVTGVSGIREARKGDITFLAGKRYENFLETTRASAVVVSTDAPPALPLPAIRVNNPEQTFNKVVELFKSTRQGHPLPGVHHTAVLGKGVTLGANVSIGAYGVMEEGVVIGKDTVLYPGVYIGHGSSIGSQSVIYPGVVIREEVEIGDHVIIHSGAVIGSDGFGYETRDGVHHKIPQLGSVVIEDDVEIGANVTIDRARFDKTLVRKGTKIDNLVHLAHNVIVGEACLIAAQTGISGSTTVGKGVRMGGQVGVNGHIQIGDGVAVAGQSGVTKNTASGEMVQGTPARPHQQVKREWAAVKRLSSMVSEVKRLKDEIKRLQERLDSLEKTAKNT